MASTSTVPAARAALVDLIAEAVDLPVGAVTYGETSSPLQERVIVGDTASGGQAERNWALLGATPRARDERYSIAITVVVARPGYSQQRATERAYELWAAIEQAHIDNPTLSVDGVIVTALDQPIDTDLISEQGFASELTSALMVHARITRSTP